MKRNLLFVFLIGHMVLLSACSTKEDTSLTLPDRSDVISVNISCGDETKTITDGKQIDSLFANLSAVSNRSGESYDDTPRTDDYLKIVFEVTAGQSGSVVYSFKNREGFFVEQPYNGIFSIEEAFYLTISQQKEGSFYD